MSNKRANGIIVVENPSSRENKSVSVRKDKTRKYKIPKTFNRDHIEKEKKRKSFFFPFFKVNVLTIETIPKRGKILPKFS